MQYHSFFLYFLIRIKIYLSKNRLPEDQGAAFSDAAP
jgi:hypothetical protein